MLCLHFASILVAAGCDIADADRCADGYRYDSEINLCLLEENAGIDTDTASDSASDGGADGGGGQTGFGEPCESSEDCAEFDAFYCALPPAPLPGSGYCTIDNCATGGTCPERYQCCDCREATLAAIPKMAACAKNTDAAALNAVPGCTCR